MSEAATGPVGALTGTILSERYRLESKLGSGGMSTVYLARDETLERWVAAKVLHREISDQPDQIERFRREARAVAQVSHPNVVAVIDAGEDGGRPYIVFEYVEGETLKQRIEELGHLPLDEAAAYAIEIGRGLGAAHSRMLVHRDVKPQNVLIDPEGRAKVTDFGIARELESDGLTKTGRVLGTTDYVSPEQAMGHEVDARSDIYSLGILLYEMLTGDVPFKAETLVGVAMKHVNEPMPDVQRKRRDTSSALAAVIDRSTAKEPKKRYSDMPAMLDDLEGALEVEVARAGTAHGEATSVLESVPEGRRHLPTPSRRTSLVGILLVLVATGIALAIAALTGEDENPPRGSGSAGATAAEIEIAGAEDFDPQGEPAPEEHPDEVGLAIDGIPGSAWSTEDYTSGPDLSSYGKDGVGLIIETEEPVAATQMTVTTDTPGFEATIYGAAEGPPEDLEGWGEPLSQPVTVEEEQTIQLNSTSENRFYLILITTLAEIEDGSGARINDVSLSS
jgi:tRNA A-37 threonylcarbamoyl transferase component Bud32